MREYVSAFVHGTLSPDIDTFYHALTTLRDQEGYMCDHVEHLRPPTILRSVEDVAGLLGLTRSLTSYWVMLTEDSRAVETALGDGVKVVYESEVPIKAKLRRKDTKASARSQGYRGP